MAFRQVKHGDSIYSILRTNGFNNSQMSKILSQAIIPKSYSLARGEKYSIVRNQPDYLEIRFYHRFTDDVFIYWRKGKSEAHSEVTKGILNKKLRHISGKVQGSIIGSIQRQVNDRWVAYRFLDAFSLDYDLSRQLQRGAKFNMQVEEVFDGDHPVKFGQVLYASVELKGEKVERHFVEFESGGSFIHEETLKENKPFYLPVDDLRISSHFDPKRLHPIKKRRQPHYGTDFELEKGKPVYTVFAGRILRKGKNRAAGYYVVIRHPNGMESYYNHLDSINKSVKVGSYVSNGKTIGTIGCTGYCTKPHLHFALKKSGHYVNPIQYLKSYPFQEKRLVATEVARLTQESP